MYSANNKFLVGNFVITSETYLELSQISTMQLLAVNYFCKKLYRRCLSGF